MLKNETDMKVTAEIKYRMGKEIAEIHQERNAKNVLFVKALTQRSADSLLISLFF